MPVWAAWLLTLVMIDLCFIGIIAALIELDFYGQSI
jgi:hypothetical protein